MLAAYLLTRHHEWSRATIRLLADDRAEPDATTAALEAMLEDARIDATVYPVAVPSADRVAHLVGAFDPVAPRNDMDDLAIGGDGDLTRRFEHA